MTTLTWRPDHPEGRRLLITWLMAHNVSFAEGPIMADILYDGVPVLVLLCPGLPDIVIQPGESFQLDHVKRDPVQPVNGCHWCGIVDRDHGNLWTFGRGWHRWEAPTDAIRLGRLRLQRQLRLTTA